MLRCDITETDGGQRDEEEVGRVEKGPSQEEGEYRRAEHHPEQKDDDGQFERQLPSLQLTVRSSLLADFGVLHDELEEWVLSNEHFKNSYLGVVLIGGRFPLPSGRTEELLCFANRLHEIALPYRWKLLL